MRGWGTTGARLVRDRRTLWAAVAVAILVAGTAFAVSSAGDDPEEIVTAAGGSTTTAGESTTTSTTATSRPPDPPSTTTLASTTTTISPTTSAAAPPPTAVTTTSTSPATCQPPRPAPDPAGPPEGQALYWISNTSSTDTAWISVWGEAAGTHESRPCTTIGPFVAPPASPASGGVDDISVDQHNGCGHATRSYFEAGAQFVLVLTENRAYPLCTRNDPPSHWLDLTFQRL